MEIYNKKDLNYFIFVFNEKFYENETSLGSEFNFPEVDKGGYKYVGKSIGSWGKIIGKVRKGDKVIWTISGSSKRHDKKTFWGYGKVLDIDMIDNLWRLESFEFQKKIRIDEVIKKFPEIYKNLYVLSSGIINLGYYGTIQIDKFQYDFIYEFYTDFKDNYLKSSELYRYGSFSNKLSTSVINSNNKDVWKCPKKSCNHEVIKITRNKDNIIDNKTYTSIIIHFLRHLSRENPLFGGMDIFKIFLEHSPEEVLSNEDLGQYEYDGRVSDTIWKNQIRSSLNSLRSRRLIETEASSELIQNCSIDIKDKRKFRKRKRSKTFFDKFEIYNDWSLYLNEIPIGKETSISEDSISQKNTSIPDVSILSPAYLANLEDEKIKELLLSLKKVKTKTIYSTLNKGNHKETKLEEIEIWKIFEDIFNPSKTKKTTSYKFGLIYSIIDNIELLSNELLLSFDQIFLSFTKIYWKLVVHHRLRQVSGSSNSLIFTILTEYSLSNPATKQLEFNSILRQDKTTLLHRVKKECSRNVFGALYGDSKELFYSFDRNKEFLQLSPFFKDFIMKYKEIIKKLNFYEWLKFIDSKNKERNIDIHLFE